LSKHRRLELTHFCLQYREWEKERNAISMYLESHFKEVKNVDIPDPTFDISARRLELEEKMNMVKQSASECDPFIGDKILIAVIDDRAFSYFEARGISCGKDMFYDRLRKFFWILDKYRK